MPTVLTTTRPSILILADHFLPGFRAGGPIRSIANMVEALGGEFRFLILTRDRDLGASEPYPGIAPRRWYPVGSARAMYLRPAELAPNLTRAMSSIPHDLLYLNSLFSPAFGVRPLVWRRFGRVPSRPVVLAPRGELDPGALRLKGQKKSQYLRLARPAGVYRDVLWHASSPLEESNIRRVFGPGARVQVASNVPGTPDRGHQTSRNPKSAGSLRVAFLSRVARKKNLEAAIDVLSEVAGDIRLDIHGPIEDARYWERCRRKLGGLPAHVRWRYCGEVPHAKVVTTLRRHDVLLFPTLGENFGHVIVEAMLAGCVPIISDQTPWRGLAEAGVGWDIPLHDRTSFVRALQSCVDMGAEEFERLSRRCVEYVDRYVDRARPADEHRTLFETAMERS